VTKLHLPDIAVSVAPLRLSMELGPPIKIAPRHKMT